MTRCVCSDFKPVTGGGSRRSGLANCWGTASAPRVQPPQAPCPAVLAPIRLTVHMRMPTPASARLTAPRCSVPTGGEPNGFPQRLQGGCRAFGCHPRGQRRVDPDRSDQKVTLCTAGLPEKHGQRSALLPAFLAKNASDIERGLCLLHI